MRIEPLAGSLGAVIHDVDLASIDDTTFESIHKAWLDHLVIFFRDQHLDPAAHAAFARRFGELEIHPFAEKLDDAHPEVTLLHSERGGRADVWHSDVTFSNTPPIAAVLRYLHGPSAGGDTIWSNQYAAYEALSPKIRELIDDLEAVHGRPGLTGTTTHPMVITHPDTGRRALFVNRGWTTRIVGLSHIESQGILGMLFDHAERPDSVRWTWRPGDAALWDNRCTMHYAVNDYGDATRILHRVTIYAD